MRAILALAFASLMLVSASAQTVESTLDLSALGWGGLDTPEPIETDGDFTTREWLIRSYETNLFRVVAELGEGLCAGPWFQPKSHPFSPVALRRVGLTHVLLVREVGRDVVTIVRLETPACPRVVIATAVHRTTTRVAR